MDRFGGREGIQRCNGYVLGYFLDRLEKLGSPYGGAFFAHPTKYNWPLCAAIFHVFFTGWVRLFVIVYERIHKTRNMHNMMHIDTVQHTGTKS